jgi:hypothetical protein
VNGIFEDFKRQAKPSRNDQLPGLNLFFDIAEDLLTIVAYGDKVKKAVNLVNDGEKLSTTFST